MKFVVEIKHRWNASVLFTTEVEAAEDASDAVKTGLAAREAVKRRACLIRADLRGADLRGADLGSAYLRGADLRRADLRGACLSGACLSGADLRSAYLIRADLIGADMREADLIGADMREADMRGAYLGGADLRDADLSDADLGAADLGGADLRRACLSGDELRSFKADFWMILLQNKPEVSGLIAALREGRVDGSTYEGECSCLVGTIANVRGVPVDTLELDSDRPAEQWFLMISKGDKPGDESGGGFAAKMALEWAVEFCAYAGIALAGDSMSTTKAAKAVVGDDPVNAYFKTFYPASFDISKWEYTPMLGGMNRYVDHSVSNIFPRITCTDGFSMSVQGHYGTYSHPRDNFAAHYTHVEVGFPSAREDLLMEFAEEAERPTETVYAYVPVEVVAAVIQKHGGFAPTRRPPMADAIHTAFDNLRTNQRQLDADGCEVGMSRQALDETLDIYAELLAACRELVDVSPIDSEWGYCSCCSSQIGHTPHCPVEMARAAISKATGQGGDT